jgi:hypothetical protein
MQEAEIYRIAAAKPEFQIITEAVMNSLAAGEII